VCSVWGTIPLIVRRVPLPAAAIVAVRLWVAALGLGAALVVTRRRSATDRPRLLSVRPILCLASGLVLAVHWISLFSAYKRAPAGTVILIVYLAPIGVAALAPATLGERVGSRTLWALAVGAAGFVLVAWPAVHGASAAGLGLALLAAVMFVVLVLVSKPLSEAYGGLRLAFMEMAGAGVILIPIALGTAWGHPQASWLWLLVLGLVHTAVGIGLYLGALARVPATHVAILGYLEPASVVLCGWLFLSQRPAVETIVGGVLIVLAGALVVRSTTMTEEVVAGVVG
jgi:drug/metabolite transporter (DMT)-like permease